MIMLFNPTKINLRSFWFYQIIGWSIYYAAITFVSFFQKESYFALGILDNISGFLLTSLLRLKYKRIKYQELSIFSLIGLIAFWSILTTIIWHCLSGLIQYWVYGDKTGLEMLLPYSMLSWIKYSSLLYLGWSVLYFGLKYWMDWDQQREQIEKANAINIRAQFQMFRYRLNPHFVFNALNTIRALIGDNTNLAKLMITDLSECLRYTLMSKNGILVLLKDELNAIKHYLSIEKMQYEEKLEIRFEIDPSTEDLPITSFLIQPLVENAIRYGMETSPYPLQVCIRTMLHDGNLRITVINTGKWINSSEKSQNNSPATKSGIENVKAQLENVFPGRYYFKTFEKDGTVHADIEIIGITKDERVGISDY